MSLTVVWYPPAEHDLLALHWRTSGSRISEAVYHFARTTKGDLRVVRGDVSAPLRLYVASYVVRMSLNTTTGTLYVWRVLRSR
ncbi:MAG TPA: hypothetical protein PK141_04455 [Polyangiaceae bacterium]|nr:hypothetical protein [Polyangiaceae bacterium]